MTDKELIQQAFNALNNMTDLFPDALGGHSQEAENACNAALVVMADLAARLQQPEKTNQCAETCERAKLCAVCGVSLNQDQGAVAWMYTNAQGKTVIVEGDVEPYEDAVPLFKSDTQPGQKPWVGLTDDEILHEYANVLKLKPYKLETEDELFKKKIVIFGRNLEAKLTGKTHDKSKLYDS